MPSEFGIIPYRALAKEQRKAFNRIKGIQFWQLLCHVQKRNTRGEREVTDKSGLGTSISDSDHGTNNCSSLGSRKMKQIGAKKGKLNSQGDVESLLKRLRVQFV